MDGWEDDEEAEVGRENKDVEDSVDVVGATSGEEKSNKPRVPVKSTTLGSGDLTSITGFIDISFNVGFGVASLQKKKQSRVSHQESDIA